MQVPLPIRGDPASRRGHRLVERMVLRWGEGRTFGELLGGIVPPPVLAGLEAADQPVLRLGGVVAGMLRGREVAATDVTAPRTAT